MLGNGRSDDWHRRRRNWRSLGLFQCSNVQLVKQTAGRDDSGH
jgi:hypothetical protein